MSSVAARQRHDQAIGRGSGCGGAAAVPVSRCEPADATHAAPISAIDAVRVGRPAPPIMSAMLRATALPISADGIPVRGGAEAMGVPSGGCVVVVRGTEIACGGAKAIPAAKMLAKAGDW